MSDYEDDFDDDFGESKTKNKPVPSSRSSIKPLNN